jgi:hypothetical protein
MNKTITPKKFSATIEKNEKIDDKNTSQTLPGQQVINNILNYSKALSIAKSKTIEQVEVVLN